MSLEWERFSDDGARLEMEYHERDRAVMFYRSLGFRRIGNTVWFALASENDHTSHQLAATEDWNIPKLSLAGLSPLLTSFQQISETSSAVWYRLSDSQPHEKPDLLRVLHDYMEREGSSDDCWKSTDQYGNTVLHLTASVFDAACVDWILDQDFRTQLLEVRNHRGETPLEKVQFKLELRTQRPFRMKIQHVSDKFEGHNENAVRCIISLKGLGTEESFVKSHGADALLRLTRGCTCGQCLEGFLSPRMLLALQWQAEMGHEMIANVVNDWSSPKAIKLEERCLWYLPSKVLLNLDTNKSMRQGFANL